MNGWRNNGQVQQGQKELGPARYVLATSGLVVLGSAAWLTKLAVIAATNGRVLDAGVPGALFTLGILLLVVGSTSVGVWFARRASLVVRVLLALVSPALLLGSFVLLGALLSARFEGVQPAWIAQEVGVFAAALVWLAIGVSLQRVARSARGSIVGAGA